MKQELNNKYMKATLLNQYFTSVFRGKQIVFFGIMALIFIIAIIVFLLYKNFGEGKAYVNIIEPVVTLGTFCIAALLGIQNIKETWKNQLPKKLTVHFKFKDNYVFTCHKAYLFGESDIRQMGQQIGLQMNDNKKLSFYPYVKLEPSMIVKRGKEYFRHYEVTFFLSSCDKEKYKVWWDNNPSTFGNKEWNFDKKNEIISEEEADEIYEKSNQIKQVVTPELLKNILAEVDDQKPI